MSEKKKIGILTFHNAHNYGAVLQAYALKTKLNRMGYEAKILNYRNPYIARLYRKVIHIDFWKRDILPSRWGKVIREVGENLYGLKEWQSQWRVFERFIEDHLLDGQTKKLTMKDLEKEQCDVYILGSDQIWARELTHGFDPVYFGQFAPEHKKISYAASVPNGNIPETEQGYFRQALKNLAHISVREEKLAQAVEKLVGKEVTTVVDPTLLLEKNDYEELLYEKPLVQEKYIFAYFVVENAMLDKCAKKAAEITGYRLIELHYKKTPELNGENIIFDAGPREFLTYIRDAELIFTNSFHGTVFSILFQKKFYSVYKENGRITNLLTFLNLESRHIKAENEIDDTEVIDYHSVADRLCSYRSQSVDYLKKGIEQ